MKSRDLITLLTLAGLIAGGLTGEYYYRSTLGLDPDAGLLERYDEIVQSRMAEDFDDSTTSREKLEAAHHAASPLIARRSFGKLSNLIGRDIFMGLLKMLIMPLIVSSVICGVTSAGDFSRLGRIALKTFFYFFMTMIFAVILGMTMVSLFQPGADFFSGPQGERQRDEYLSQGVHRQEQMTASQANHGIVTPKSTAEALTGILVRMIPRNPVKDIAEGNTLPVIVFSILFGIMLTMTGGSGRVVVNFAAGIMAAMIKLTEYVLWLAPVGVFFLVAKSVSGIGMGQFIEKIGSYMLTVIAALLFHGLIILPIILAVFTRTNPYRFMVQMKEALMMAFATASSSATLPVTMDNARTTGGCSRKAAGFVLPLGSTINMDGTALYEAVAVIFLAQAFSGGQLGLETMIVLALTATLAAVGAAGIPEAGLTTMIIVISAVNAGGSIYIPPASIGLILGVDRILDMTRTMINVWGDAVGTKLISRTEGDEALPDPVPED
jgi:Na+/H+-dicarboxylate symporter